MVGIEAVVVAAVDTALNRGIEQASFGPKTSMGSKWDPKRVKKRLLAASNAHMNASRPVRTLGRKTEMIAHLVGRGLWTQVLACVVLSTAGSASEVSTSREIAQERAKIGVPEKKNKKREAVRAKAISESQKATQTDSTSSASEGSSTIVTTTENAAAATQTKPSRWTDHLRLDYAGQYTGWRLSEGDFANQPSASGGICCPAELFNQITVGYRTGYKGWTISALTRFGWLHSYTKAALGTVFWYNPRISIATPSLFTVGKVNFSGNILFDLPLSKESTNSTGDYVHGRFRDLITAPAFLTVISYDPPKSKWSLGAIVNYRYFIYGDSNLLPAGGIRKRQSEWYIAPFAYYKFAETWSWMILWEHFFRSFNNTGVFQYPQRWSSLQLGANWDITPNFSIAPYIATYVTANDPASYADTAVQPWKAVSFGMYLSAKAF